MRKIKTIGERLQYIRKTLNLSQKELADRSGGVSRPTLSRIEGNIGGTSYHDILKVCQCLNISVDWLLTGEGRMSTQKSNKLTPEDITMLKHFRRLDADDKSHVINFIKFYSVEKKNKKQKEQPEIINEKIINAIHMKVYDVSVSAGLGFYLDNESTYELKTFDADEVPEDADFGMRISGESMEPTIEDGSIVWIKPMPSVNNGKIGIFIHNNELLCKELYVNHEKKRIQLLSHNPDYEPITVDEYDSFGTVGLVLI